ncbi:hypothetical protein, unknown function [Leishmania tarentolae]|uniref:Leucine-rich repeat protein n=1 Tax=Leishmania tarentolae TaxID=5689 RepID=A0A640KIF5_LEITA|nr:hypothetical protein, unknown function [Leishmania tarentolae]
MGNASWKDRCDRAATTGILTLNTQNIKSWSSLIKVLKKLTTLRIITITRSTLPDPVPYAFTAVSLWSTLVSLDLSHNGLTCACALGSEVPLPKKHAGEARSRITAAPVSNSSPDTTQLPLESLNISGNNLHMLPPLLATRFPRLRRLVCTENERMLDIPLSLARCIGPSKSLEVVSLQRNRLETFVLADSTVDEPFPALRELLLDENRLGGTVNLGLSADEGAPMMPSLRRITLDGQSGKEPLCCVDAAIFVHCPGLTSLSLRGNCTEEAIHDLLMQSAVYRKWQERKKDVVDKKLHAGGQAELI